MNAEFDFEIYVTMGAKKYRMEVTTIYQGDSLEKFKVKGGNRYIILQSNRPYLKNKNKREKIEWKLLEGGLSDANPKTAAEALNKIITQIEYHIKDQPVPLGVWLRAAKR